MPSLRQIRKPSWHWPMPRDKQNIYLAELFPFIYILFDTIQHFSSVSIPSCRLKSIFRQVGYGPLPGNAQFPFHRTEREPGKGQYGYKHLSGDLKLEHENFLSCYLTLSSNAWSIPISALKQFFNAEIPGILFSFRFIPESAIVDTQIQENLFMPLKGSTRQRARLGTL